MGSILPWEQKLPDNHQSQPVTPQPVVYLSSPPHAFTRSHMPLIGEKPMDDVDETWIEELREASVWLTKSFWTNTAVRAVRTFVQTVVALAATAGTGLFEMSWSDTLIAGGSAAFLSVLMSVDRSAKD
jgi:hypothetical protein